MGRRENPITTSNRALAELAQWLRDRRTARGLTYARLAALTGLHATTLQRAASGASVPTSATVRAYAEGCGAPPEIALGLRTRARQEKLSGAGDGQEAPTPEAVRDPAGLSAALRGLHAEAGGPTLREMERRAGGYGELPHSTAHRILRGEVVPSDERQLVAYLDACDVPPRERQRWVDAWRRVCAGQEPEAAPAKDAGAAPRNDTFSTFDWQLRRGRQLGPVRFRQPAAEARPARSTPAADAAPDAAPGEAPGEATRLRFSVLGPVRAWSGGRQLSTGSPQQRALLAALLLRGGRTAPAEELVDALWGEEPPEQAKAALRPYASRIRKSLGPHAAMLRAESGGYALRLDAADILDVDTAQRFTVLAEEAETEGDVQRAHELFGSALAEWDGEPLAHVPGPYADTHRSRLGEWRLGLQESQVELLLRLGRHAEAASELTALTAAHPLRERLRELLMLALYRSGRQAEALAVYADTRRLLADELGVDPRPELAELQQRILEADEELAFRPDRVDDAATATFVRPAQLPATVPDFTGRASCVRELGGRLTGTGGAATRVSVVAGIGGVGKTALAVHTAHSVRDRFPDGQLYIDLRGTGENPTDPADALGSFLRALGVPADAVPEGTEERGALFRSLLADRRVLVVLDDARDATQVRPLLPGAAGCAALVVGRSRMAGLPGARLTDLDVMGPDEAMALFGRVVGEERVAPERRAAMDAVAACGFLPLAVRIAAGRLAVRRTWTVSDLAARLADEHGRLDELRSGDLSVRDALTRGYRRLGPEQARAFRLLGSTDGPDVSVREAALLLGRSAEDAEEVLESLVDTSLLEAAGPGRYRLHDLVRLSARELPGEE